MHRTPARRSTPLRPRAGCFLDAPGLISTRLPAAKPWYLCAGCFLNTLGLVFLGVSHTSDGVNLLHPGAILIGLGGITFHLAQVPFLACITAQPTRVGQCA